jgi:hypothetical protein
LQAKQAANNNMQQYIALIQAIQHILNADREPLPDERLSICNAITTYYKHSATEPLPQKCWLTNYLYTPQAAGRTPAEKLALRSATLR